MLRCPTYTLFRRQQLPRGLSETFAFFERPQNLASITPPWLEFRLLTPEPIRMAPNLLLDYTIRVFGRRTRWRSVIAEYDPPHGFRDVQVSGPYRRWDHRHRFWEFEGQTVMEDLVRYQLPLGPLGALLHRLAVHRRLVAIFDYRRDRIWELLVGPSTTAARAGRLRAEGE